jgi:HemY protein
MRGVIWVVLLFVAAVVAASTLGRNDGLVTFYWGHWRLDLSLNLFLLALLVSSFVLYTVIKGVNALVTLPSRAREWRTLKRERAAQASLRESLAELFAARYSRSQKAAQRALAIQDSTPELEGDHDLRVLGHLLSAASAHKLQDRPTRDDHVNQVFRISRGRISARAVDDGARLLASEWALDDRDATRALQLLGELPPGTARRTHALRLKLQATRLDHQPLDALRTARLLAKHQGFSRLAAQGLLRSLACEALETTHDIDQLRRTWMQMDQADRRDTVVAARAARHAATLGAHEEGRQWLRPFWDRLPELPEDEREELALALLRLLPGMGADWLPRLEGALAAFPHQPVIQVAVGAAFAERRLWGKARRLLEDAARAPGLRASARRHAWRTLAQLAREEGDLERAADCDHEAAAID